ncbi:winged helix-turn-helix domain-containing tetratricopeptide repeat protein [Bradyrhizobium sp. 2S1]|uniref:winged helix-turn-helix domain-containing tetratricopeptide repeat protein n=1 Tax=Bradyrhizobium sp. 2S1 TaxID=1404429 RepID=UPI001409B476|nr:winged helix-turn-helix domain-containing protein [Bradyrhizobium sp. 2S1]MCK7669308.1 winged helix-turn-helix domain-containing protein [Bradyrhizobium sp. 2S1]
MRYFFEGHVLDTGTRELHRAGELVSITPQVFDLLEFLIRNRERVVRKDELIDAIWSGRAVSDAALTTRLNAVRSAIGDSGSEQRRIKTMPRRGFRFIAPVNEVKEHAGAREAAASSSLFADDDATIDGASDQDVAAGEARVDEKPAPRRSILVLPLTSIGGGPEQAAFADGVTESLITDLSRTRYLFIAARRKPHAPGSKAVDIRRAGRDATARYVLESSIQRSGNRLRVNAQLIDVVTGRHLWDDRFEKQVLDPFDLQDEIALRLAHLVSTQLILDEARRAKRLMFPSPGDLIIQGMASLCEGLPPQSSALARGFFERALALDNRYTVALIGLANIDVNTCFFLLADDPAATLSRAEANIIKALSFVPNNAHAHFVLGNIYALTNRVDQGIAAYEKAMELDHSMTSALGCIGFAKCFIGRAAEAEGHILEALRLGPHHVDAHYLKYFMGETLIYLAEDAKAVDWLRRSIETNRNLPRAHFALAAALGLLGNADEARRAVQEGLSVNPSFTIWRLQVNKFSNNPAYLAGLDRFIAGLRLAGVPEG